MKTEIEMKIIVLNLCFLVERDKAECIGLLSLYFG